MDEIILTVPKDKITLIVPNIDAKFLQTMFDDSGLGIITEQLCNDWLHKNGVYLAKEIENKITEVIAIRLFDGDE